MVAGMSGVVSCTSGKNQWNPRSEIRLLHTPKIGEKIVLPAITDPSEAQATISDSQPNLYLLILSDTQPLSFNSGATLSFYAAAGDKTPVYSYKVSDFKNMAQTTNCSQQVSKYLIDKKPGEVMFCNGALDLKKVHYFVLKESDTDNDNATGYTVDFVDAHNGVVAVTLAFY
jgi:hypothetical protein